MPQLTHAELARYGGFGVLNRPYSVSHFMRKGGLRAMAEDYVYIAETDHVLLKPLPNLASEASAYGYAFHYMHTHAGVARVLAAHVDDFPAVRGLQYSQVQTIGPSPVIIKKASLEKITPLWLDLSLALKKNPVADKMFGCDLHFITKFTIQ